MEGLLKLPVNIYVYGFVKTLLSKVKYPISGENAAEM